MTVHKKSARGLGGSLIREEESDQKGSVVHGWWLPISSNFRPPYTSLGTMWRSNADCPPCLDSVQCTWPVLPLATFFVRWALCRATRPAPGIRTAVKKLEQQGCVMSCVTGDPQAPQRLFILQPSQQHHGRGSHHPRTLTPASSLDWHAALEHTYYEYSVQLIWWSSASISKFPVCTGLEIAGSSASRPSEA